MTKLDIAGGVTIVLSLGGLVTSAILYPPLIPAFAIVGGITGSLMSRPCIRDCFNGIRAMFGQPVRPLPSVNVAAQEVAQAHPTPIERQLRTVQKSFLLQHNEMSIHHHDSFKQGGKHVTIDETITYTEDATKPATPRVIVL